MVARADDGSLRITSAWHVRSPEPERARKLASELSLSPLVGQLLLNRGIHDPERARRFLDPRLSDLRRPDGEGGEGAMAGFDRAVERLQRAIAEREMIGLFGDYDVDGVTSCALLADFFGQVGARVHAEVARRDAGYGLGVETVDRFAEAGAQVVVTCDCGTSDHEALSHARRRGIDVVVVDHHQVPEREPEAHALINPHQTSCRFPYKGLASVGVAFYLAAALRTRLRAEGRRNLPDPRALLDLVAVGTVADMAPLTDENRILVHAGLRLLARAPRPGLRALLELSGGMSDRLRSIDIGMRIGPRLNAPGRLGDARPALDLLLAPGPIEGRALAERLELANQKRRELQLAVEAAALEEAERHQGAAIVVAGQGWPAGVVGIDAARLVERYGRPAAVIALEGEVGRGSLRSAGGFDLVSGLRSASDLLIRYGGHAVAAGLTIAPQNVDAFRQRFCAAVAESLGRTPPRPRLEVDAEIDLEALDERLLSEISQLEPFGIGNPEPCLGSRDLVLERSRVVGSDHLQVTLRDGPYAHDGIGFSFASRDPGAGARVRAAFVPEIDTFRGARRVRVRLRDLVTESDRPSEAHAVGRVQAEGG
jgi:single-stranded-DNA-specific exonuclease